MILLRQRMFTKAVNKAKARQIIKEYTKNLAHEKLPPEYISDGFKTVRNKNYEAETNKAIKRLRRELGEFKHNSGRSKKLMDNINYRGRERAGSIESIKERIKEEPALRGVADEWAKVMKTHNLTLEEMKDLKRGFGIPQRWRG